jgi:hypothetical protein
MKLNLNLLLLLFGSAITLAVGLLTAYIPGLAYVTVYKYFLDVPNPPFGLPYVTYPPLDISTHLYTNILLVSATGGLLGLIGLFWKRKQSYIGVAAIGVASIGLMLPVTNNRISFPELSVFDVRWIGFFIVLVGICLMFLGLAIKETNVPRVTFLSVPLLLAGYSIRPLLVLTNNLQGFTSSINMLMLILMVTGYLLMIWGIVKILLPKIREKIRLLNSNQRLDS